MAAMSGDEISQGRRTIATIEGDLLKAEAAFSEADTRLKQAESDYRNALDKINKYQAEIDGTVADWRQRSVTGSKWRLATGKAEDVLILQPEAKTKDGTDSNEANLTSLAAAKTVPAYVEDLEAHAQSENGDSPLRVIVRRREPGFFTRS
jgi:hypothetical protein